MPNNAAVPTTRLTLRVSEAADALSVSTDYLREHVIPNLKIVRHGRLKLIPISELEAWVDSEATRLEWE